MTLLARCLIAGGCAAALAWPVLAEPPGAGPALSRRTPIWIATATAAAAHPVAPTATPAPPEPETATIRLVVPEAPPGILTQVEWQDGLGAWHPVPGWRTELTPARAEIVWAVLPEHFGRGPFRWRLGGLAASADRCSSDFWLPAFAGGLSDTRLTLEGARPCP